MNESQSEIPAVPEEYFKKELASAAEYLEKDFGITDLTNRELLYLSHHVRECQAQDAQFWKDYQANRSVGWNRIDIGREAAVRWLIDLFGVDWNHKEMALGMKVIDPAAKEEYIYGSRDYKQGFEKYLELLRRDVKSDPLLEFDIKYGEKLAQGGSGLVNPERLGNTASPEFRKLLQIWREKFNRGDY